MGTLTSMLWATNGVGDGTATGYTDAQIQRMMKLINAIDPAAEGVFYGELNNLEVTSPGANSININTGAAMIRGIIGFHDTSATAIALTSVAANTAGIVWMQADWTTQLVTLGVTQATSGDTNIPALTQTAGTTWQIPLATYILTSGGTVTLTEARDFVNADWVEEFWQAQGAGSLTASGTTYGWAYGKLPNDAIVAEEIKIWPIVMKAAGTANDVQLDIALDYGDYTLNEEDAENTLGDGDPVSGITYSMSPATADRAYISLTGGNYELTIPGGTLTVNDILLHHIYRIGSSGSDTFAGNLTHYGSVIRYLKRK